MNRQTLSSEFSLFFELPSDGEVGEVAAQTVLAMPDTWGWVNGILKMPKLVQSSDMLAGSSGFELGSGDKVAIVGGYDGKGRRNEPDIVRIVSTPALPDFVSFSYAGLHARGSISYAKQIAAALLQQGYLGGLYFYRDGRRDVETDNSARASFCFTPQGSQPPFVRLEWFPHYGGNEACVVPVAEMCRSLGLVEYGPRAPARTTAH